jgi:hypothetical protein
MTRADGHARKQLRWAALRACVGAKAPAPTPVRGGRRRWTPGLARTGPRTLSSPLRPDVQLPHTRRRLQANSTEGLTGPKMT